MTHSPGVILTFNPPRITPTLTTTCDTTSVAPLPRPRSTAVLISGRSRAELTLAGTAGLRRAIASNSPINRAAILVALALMCGYAPCEPGVVTVSATRSAPLSPNRTVKGCSVPHLERNHQDIHRQDFPAGNGFPICLLFL